MVKLNIFKSIKPDVGLSNESGREAWLQKNLLKVPKSSRILDAGAGNQRYKRFCGHLDYVSQDFAQYDGVGDEHGLQMGEFDYGSLDIVSDISSIPEPDASFDAIMCVEVLEHLPEPLAALREFSRLLKPGGLLILTAPFCSLTHFAPYHFATGFSSYWYEKHLGELGFSIDGLSPNGNYFEYMAQENYRLPLVSSRYANKKVTLFQMFCLYVVQRMLKNLSEADSNSSELLCFGFHVLAIKND